MESLKKLLYFSALIAASGCAKKADVRAPVLEAEATFIESRYIDNAHSGPNGFYVAYEIVLKDGTRCVVTSGTEAVSCNWK